MTAQLSRKNFILLILLTLFWGINWPIMKFGIRAYPPLTFRFLGMLGGVLVIWLVAKSQKDSIRIPKGQLGRVILITIPNMIVWHLFIIYGVKLLSSGRAAILGYTMPIWAVVFGFLFFNTRISMRASIGILCAGLATFLLLYSELANMAGQPVGVMLALIAAAGWGLGTCLVKRIHIDLSSTVLTMWMLLFTTVPTFIAAFIFEYTAWRWPDTGEWASIIFNMVIAFGFCHVVWFRLARILPPVVSGLSVMMIPVVGIFSSMLLGEVPYWQDYVAMVLVLVAMGSVLLTPKTPPADSTYKCDN